MGICLKYWQTVAQMTSAGHCWTTEPSTHAKYRHQKCKKGKQLRA